jgi:flagellar hook-associated protein 2
MATSAVSSTSTSTAAKTQAAVAASNKANAQKIMTSLSAGSGVDTASLAQNLVDAERVPRENAINAKISKNESKITGLSAVMFMVSELKTKMSALKDKGSFSSLTVNNSQTAAFGVTTSTSAAVGSHDIQVTSIAKGKRVLTPDIKAFASPTTALASPFSLTLKSDNVGVSGGAPLSVDLTANGGTASGATLSGIQFGAGADPFKGLTFTADGQAVSVTIPPVSPVSNLTELQGALNSALAGAGVTDVTASVDLAAGTLTLNSATRTIAKPGLSTAGISGVSFGTTSPATTDFKSFHLTVGGVSHTLTPAPSSATLASLASDLQTQLQKLDGGSDLRILDVGDGLQVFSASGRAITDVSLSNEMQIGMTNDAVSGTATNSVGVTPARLDGVAFSTTATVNDFKEFSINIGGTFQRVIPAPGAATLSDLAANLQSQLRTLEGTTDISVIASGGNLLFSSASGRALTSPLLTKNSFAQTPEGVVAAINAKNAGVKAELVSTGNTLKPYKILVTGATGASQDFTLTSATAELEFSGVPGYTHASDAVFLVNGIAMTCSTNTVTDAIAGVTLNLRAPTSGTATLDLTRDTASLTTKMTELVTAYNDANDLLNQVSDPKSTLDTYGGTLVGDSTVRTVRQQLRGLFQGASSTPGTTVSAFWQLGVSVDEKGKMSLDNAKLDASLSNNFSDVVKSLTGNYDNLSAFSKAPAGLMGDAVRKLTNLLDPKGPLMSQSDSANTQNTKYQKDLTDLQTRMDSLLARYTKQFAAMDSMVGQVNSQKTSLKSTFDGMMAAYTNK